MVSGLSAAPLGGKHLSLMCKAPIIGARLVSPAFAFEYMTTTEELRQLIISELESLDFTFDEEGNLTSPNSKDKEAIRRLHQPAQQAELEKSQSWIKHALSRYKHFFAEGSEIIPESIKPRLVQVTLPWHSDLFRLARYYWSLPYSFGFGRRLRYLVLDDVNNKLVGIFGLQSPPIHFPARDKLFEYPEGTKTALVNQTMDIFTLGAIPPYNRLLGGKLIALAVTCNEVRRDYYTKYFGRKTEMEERVLPAHLVGLTTTSAFGRSSIYNRLKYKGRLVAESLGYTEGYGNFHLQRLYPAFKEYLEAEGISTQGGYGTGPKRTWQLIRRVLDSVDIPGDPLKHGVRREVFLFRLVSNLEDYLEGRAQTPDYFDYPFSELAQYWKERWLIARAERVDGWHQWESQKIVERLILNDPTNE